MFKRILMLLVCLGALLHCVAANAVTIDFPSFPAASLTNFQLNGQAATVNPVSGESVLRLTDATMIQAGSAFLKDPVTLVSDLSFSTTFQFRMTDGLADGFAFVMQKDGNTFLGTPGGYLAYEGASANPSVAVEFDTFYNAGWDPSANHIGINWITVNSLATADVSPNLNNGEVWTAWIDYNGATKVMEVRVSNTGVRPDTANLTYAVDLDPLGNELYLGFTAGTGGQMQNHDILSWQFNSPPSPVPLPSSLVLLGTGLAFLKRFRKKHPN
jgi:hypothetical protein